MKILLIVESPAKAKTIKQYLNEIDKSNEYIVKASFGHIRDLKEKLLSIDVDNGFVMSYDILAKKSAIVSELQKSARECGLVYLASDNDREGESIAWHIREALHLPKSKYKRITFNEITKTALDHAIKNPRDIDMNLVDAQQARRCIDRLVGFTLSPLLWKTFSRKTLSAGRVQSAVLALLVKREDNINVHEDTKYWQVSGSFNKSASGSKLEAKLCAATNKNPIRFSDANEAEDFLKSLSKSVYKVSSIDEKERAQYPPAPFITSTLQQEAYNSLRMGATTCMKVAQDLYEAGLITYMRTDSYNLSTKAIADIKQVVIDKFGQDYYRYRVYNRKVKGAQEAHEAIRPTSFKIGFDQVKERMSASHAKLYQIIWQRTVACQMSEAKYMDRFVSIDISGQKEMRFLSTTSTLAFDGYLVLYGKEKVGSGGGGAASLYIGDVIECDNVVAENMLDTHEARYNEASLIKSLEKEGVGRPSTYAQIIDKVLKKDYAEVKTVAGQSVDGENILWKAKTKKLNREATVMKTPEEKNKVFTTDVGRAIFEFLEKNFHVITDLKFTSDMEQKLDMIAHGDSTFDKVVSEFWSALKPSIDKITSNPEKIKLAKKETEAPQILKLPSNGKEVTLRNARYGPVIEVTGSGGAAKDKRYINLKPFFGITGKELGTFSPMDAEFMLSLPKNVINGQYVLNYGQYGFFLKNSGGENVVSVTPAFVLEKFKAAGNTWDYLSNGLNTFDIETLKEQASNSLRFKNFRKKKRNVNL